VNAVVLDRLQNTDRYAKIRSQNTANSRKTQRGKQFDVEIPLRETAASGVTP
jgi:hypothetical protein